MGSGASGAGGLRRLLARVEPLVRPAVAVLVLAALVYAVVSKWAGVHATLRSLAWSRVALSLIAALAGSYAGMMAWRTLLAAEGHPRSPVVAARIFFIGQLGKYLPGSVWSVALQMELGRRSRIPRARAFTVSLVWVGLSLSTGLCVGAIALPSLANHHLGEFVALLALLPLAVALSVPPVLSRVVDLGLRVLRKPGLPVPLTWNGVLTSCAWLLAGWACYGVHLWLLAEGLGAQGTDGLMRSVGAFALAVTAGVLMVVVPSGAGVRELVIVAALSPTMPAGQALGVALVSRVLFVFVDAGSAGLATVAGLVRDRRRTRAVIAAEPL